MPPKKKCTHQKARKAELMFLERPQVGPIHCYETPLPLAQNPRCVRTKPVDQNTSAAWVCPQFETTESESVVFKACQKKHRGPQKTLNHDANHNSFHAGGAYRRAIACKFPPLTFENSERRAGHPLHHPNHSRKDTQCSHNLPKKATATNSNIQVKGPESCRDSAPRPVEQVIFSPTDAEAPQVPSLRNRRCSNTLSQSGNAWHPEKELAFGIDPCATRESAAVLVTDTPEHEYGVKVTWRRRPHLMKYLRERGKLSADDILVKASLELSKRQASA